MVINGTHATNPPAAGTTGDGNHDRQRARPAAQWRAPHWAAPAPRRQRVNLGGAGFSHAHAGAIEEPGSDQSGRQQHLPDAIGPTQRGPGNHTTEHIVQHTVEFAQFGASALQASSLLGHQALVSSTTATLAANGTVTGAVSVPQTTSQVVLNVSDGSGALVRQISLGAQSSGLAEISRGMASNRTARRLPGTYARASAAAYAIARPAAARMPPPWSTGPVRASAWARDRLE